MPINRGIFFFLSFLLLVQSCTIEKRRYISGFHIDWHHKNGSTEKPELQPETTSSERIIVQSEEQKIIHETLPIAAIEESGIQNDSLIEYPNALDASAVDTSNNIIYALVKSQENIASGVQTSAFSDIQKSYEASKKKRKMKNTVGVAVFSLIEAILSWIFLFVGVALLAGGTPINIVKWYARISGALAGNSLVNGIRVMNNTKKKGGGKKKRKTGRTTAIIAIFISGLLILLAIIAVIA